MERGLCRVLRARRNGVAEAVEVNGEGAVRAAPGREAAFIYLDVDDTFLFFNDGRHDAIVTIEVLGARAPQSVGFNPSTTRAAATASPPGSGWMPGRAG